MYMKTECLQTKRNAAWFCGGKAKGKGRVAVIKSLINVRVQEALEEWAFKDLKGISLSNQKV